MDFFLRVRKRLCTKKIMAVKSCDALDGKSIEEQTAFLDALGEDEKEFLWECASGVYGKQVQCVMVELWDPKRRPRKTFYLKHIVFERHDMFRVGEREFCTALNLMRFWMVYLSGGWIPLCDFRVLAHCHTVVVKGTKIIDKLSTESLFSGFKNVYELKLVRIKVGGGLHFTDLKVNFAHIGGADTNVHSLVIGGYQRGRHNRVYEDRNLKLPFETDRSLDTAPLRFIPYLKFVGCLGEEGEDIFSPLCGRGSVVERLWLKRFREDDKALQYLGETTKSIRCLRLEAMKLPEGGNGVRGRECVELAMIKFRSARELEYLKSTLTVRFIYDTHEKIRGLGCLADDDYMVEFVSLRSKRMTTCEDRQKLKQLRHFCYRGDYRDYEYSYGKIIQADGQQQSSSAKRQRTT